MFGFAMMRYAQVAHLQFQWTFWMPLALLGLHQWLGERRGAALLLFGVAWLGQALSNGYFFFYFSGIDHHNGVPGTAIQEAAVRAFAEALLAADTENGVNRDAADGRAVFVRHPEHAVFHRTILDACRGAGASGAAFRDDGEFLRLLLARSGQAFGPGFRLHLVGDHADGFGGAGCR